jgi:hypothetical protein
MAFTLVATDGSAQRYTCSLAVGTHSLLAEVIVEPDVVRFRLYMRPVAMPLAWWLIASEAYYDAHWRGRLLSLLDLPAPDPFLSALDGILNDGASPTITEGDSSGVVSVDWAPLDGQYAGVVTWGGPTPSPDLWTCYEPGHDYTNVGLATEVAKPTAKRSWWQKLWRRHA